MASEAKHLRTQMPRCFLSFSMTKAQAILDHAGEQHQPPIANRHLSSIYGKLDVTSRDAATTR
jgi:hypothetical protein